VDCIDLDLAGPRLLVAAAFHDARGFFLESYSRRTLLGFGIDLNFVPDNQSYSKRRGTVRGLHYQSPPYAQAKLVRLGKGGTVRRERPPAAGAGRLPARLPDARAPDVIYEVTSHYSREHDGAVLWNDPDLCIDWGIPDDAAHLSDKDGAAARFGTFRSPFVYED
jgi:dTDP-4-dehydrorhamnose 3,5-epimerase